MAYHFVRNRGNSNDSFLHLNSGTGIKYTDRVKSGVTGEQIWLQINEPTPNDKGKYVMELFDGKTGHQKTVDLSGQGNTLLSIHYRPNQGEMRSLHWWCRRSWCGRHLGWVGLFWIGYSESQSFWRPHLSLSSIWLYLTLYECRHSG